MSNIKPSVEISSTNIESANERRIKKHIYGKMQKAFLTVAPGFATIVAEQIKQYFLNSEEKRKYVVSISVVRSEVLLDGVPIEFLLEIMLSFKSIADIRLVIAEAFVDGKESFEKACENVPWELYLNTQTPVRTKVNSIASQAFHEKALREILNQCLSKHQIPMVQAEDEKISSASLLFASLIKNKLKISLSLCGDSLYKRYYRSPLSASAPLREDIAFLLIQEFFSFCHKKEFKFLPKALFVPFGGTGTLIFETLFLTLNIPNQIFRPNFFFEKMSCYKEATFNYLKKKVWDNFKQNSEFKTIHYLDINPKSVINYQECLVKFLSNSHLKDVLSKIQFHSDQKNLFALPIADIEAEDYLILLNPPYGVRLNYKENREDIYKKIGVFIHNLAHKLKTKNKKMGGLILCPDEKSWSVFLNQSKPEYHHTAHFMQGGLDIRVCYFMYDAPQS